ncbi:MAG: iron complex transport system substrate-binding protein, partial [Dokdonia sp.]
MSGKKIKYLFGLGVMLLILSCKQTSSEDSNTTLKGISAAISYADGFSITHFEDHTLLEVTSAFPGSDVSYPYVLVARTLSRKRKEDIQKKYTQTVLEIPIQSI